MNMIAFLASASSDLGDKACTVSPDAIGCKTSIFASNGFVFNAINIALVILGVVSVLMIIIGGFRYVLSGGDQAGIKSAKDTIMYAIIGLIVALLSFAIVSFVAGKIG